MKKAYRLPPCPHYDIEAMEGWLEDMALEGLFLAEDGFFLGFATFERAKPQKVRYRLATAVKHASFWNEYDRPEEDTIALSAELGWEYVCRRDDFYIYRSTDPAARELNTDSEVQAMALKELNKRFLVRVIDLIVWFAFWFVVLPLLEHDFHLLRMILEAGTPCALLVILFLLWRFWRCVRSLLHIRTLRKRLLRNGTLTHNKDWRSGALAYRAFHLVQPLLSAAFVLVLLTSIYSRVNSEIPLNEYHHPLPFATLSDFAEGDYSSRSFPAEASVRVWDDLLAPVNVDYSEFGQITAGDTVILDGSLYIDYHETIHPWLAQLLAIEYHLNDQNGSYQLLEAPDTDADFVVVYLNRYHFPCAILRKGNQILHAQFVQFGDNTLSVEEWVGILAESFG